MREWNLLRSYPQPDERVIPNRTIEHRILASYRGRDFFDGERECGYGGFLNDGRWGPVAEDIIRDYQPASVIELQCEKGFLLSELKVRGIEVCGVDFSIYARDKAIIPIERNIPERHFDLCIARGMVYTNSLSGAMHWIKKIEEIAHKAFITLAAYETKEDYWLFKQWSLLGCTILRREEWIEVLKHCGYTGDYWFVTAKTLRLTENSLMQERPWD